MLRKARAKDSITARLLVEIAAATAALVVTTAGGGGPALVVMFGAGVVV